eukprot:3212833-Amphidinium_carterae.1
MAYGIHVPISHLARVQHSFGTDVRQCFALKGCPKSGTPRTRGLSTPLEGPELCCSNVPRTQRHPEQWCITASAQHEQHQLTIARYDQKQVAPKTKPLKQDPGQKWGNLRHADLLRIAAWAEAADTTESEADANSLDHHKAGDLWDQPRLDEDDDWLCAPTPRDHMEVATSDEPMLARTGKVRRMLRSSATSLHPRTAAQPLRQNNLPQHPQFRSNRSLTLLTHTHSRELRHRVPAAEELQQLAHWVWKNNDHAWIEYDSMEEEAVYGNIRSVLPSTPQQLITSVRVPWVSARQATQAVNWHNMPGQLNECCWAAVTMLVNAKYKTFQTLEETKQQVVTFAFAQEQARAGGALAAGLPLC